MAVIDSNGKAKFDPVIRSDKGNSLLSFIYATYIVSKNPNNTDMNTKRLIALKLKDCFDIFRKGGADHMVQAPKILKISFLVNIQLDKRWEFGKILN